jgi:hypothetical protein
MARARDAVAGGGVRYALLADFELLPWIHGGGAVERMRALDERP